MKGHVELQDSGFKLKGSIRLAKDGYSAPQTAIRYLPELQRLLLLGASEAQGMPMAHCVALPPD